MPSQQRKNLAHVPASRVQVVSALVVLVVGLSLVIRRRYAAMARAVERVPEKAVVPLDPPRPLPDKDPSPRPLAADAPVAVLLLGERTEFGRLALTWLASIPAGISGVILASVS